MPVDSKHSDYKKNAPLWEKLSDCLEGEEKVKAGKTKYLPKPNASDTSPENESRFKAYIMRAVFTNFLAQTLNNNVGQVFAVPPTSEIPKGTLELVEENADGGGVKLSQQAKKALGFVIGHSRAGLLVDYPATEGTVSVEQAEREGIRPNILLIDPVDIINWRVEQVGVETKLSLVVIRENYIKDSSDEFEPEVACQYRVLRLLDKIYTVEVWRNEEGSAWKVAETLIPTDGAGNNFNEITFTFLGAESNDAEVEKPLLLDICNLNLAHYRDSADYQESVYLNGQGTPWVAGLNDSWVERHFKGGIQLGSRSIVPLPDGASAGMLQAEANGLVKEAMDQKESQMEALGAKLVERSEVQQTATEKAINSASESSILSNCADNVTAGYRKALYWAGMYANVDVKPDVTIFELNTDFAIARMTAEERAANREDYNGGLITWEEARDKLRRGGVAYLEDKVAERDIEERGDKEFEEAKRMFAAQGKGDPNEPPADEEEEK